MPLTMCLSSKRMQHCTRHLTEIESGACPILRTAESVGLSFWHPLINRTDCKHSYHRCSLIGA